MPKDKIKLKKKIFFIKCVYIFKEKLRRDFRNFILFLVITHSFINIQSILAKSIIKNIKKKL